MGAAQGEPICVLCVSSAREKYLISLASMDGHMPPTLKPSANPLANDKYVKYYFCTPLTLRRCLLDLDRCFGSFWTRRENMASDDMFKRLTFQYPECGDCSKDPNLPGVLSLIPCCVQ